MDDATRQKILELADRCEQAVGPDRELDAEIAALFGDVTWKQANYTMESYPVIKWRAPHPYAGMSEPVYLYTSSLDAARRLVPLGMNWMAGNRNQPTARAYVENGELHMSGRNKWFECVAVTPELALTAASLRAMAGDDDELP